jgi:hypothetical protein
MKRSKLSSMSIVIVMVLLSMGAVGAAAAQTSARFGTWKLKGAESNVRGPKALTRTDEPTEDGGVKVTYEGIEADGSRIAYSYTAKYDGNEYRPTGVGMGNGWQTISLKLLDDHSWEAILKRGGKVISRVTVVVSKDGKTLTQTVSGTNPAGQATQNVSSVWEKQ